MHTRRTHTRTPLVCDSPKLDENYTAGRRLRFLYTVKKPINLLLGAAAAAVVKVKKTILLVASTRVAVFRILLARFSRVKEKRRFRNRFARLASLLIGTYSLPTTSKYIICVCARSSVICVP